MIKLESLYRIY